MLTPSMTHGWVGVFRRDLAQAVAAANAYVRNPAVTRSRARMNPFNENQMDIELTITPPSPMLEINFSVNQEGVVIPP